MTFPTGLEAAGDWDIPQESCGVVGVYAPGEDVGRIAFFGLFALQHRGQESAGIAVSDGESLRNSTAMGLVAQAFREEDLQRLTGHMAIGHTRYSTAGSSILCNAQPILASGPYGELALGHNGNVVNALALRQELEEWGCRFSSTSDSEIVAQLLANAPGRDWAERVQYLMRRLQGAYSLVVLTLDSLIAIRDPLGVRPLCVGKMNGGWIVASESCALDHLGATLHREVEPGEAIVIDDQGMRTLYRGGERRRAFCVFEYIYFARPDSILGGRLTYSLRQEMGAQLAKEHPVDADVVIGVPDSATAAAVGYARETGIPYSEGLLKNRYVGRTFIEPDQRVRDLGRAAQVQHPSRGPGREARGGSRRQHRQGHHDPSRGATGQKGRRHGGTPARVRSAHQAPLPARRGHGLLSGAHCRQQERRGNTAVRRSRHPGLPERGRASRHRGRQPGLPLHGLLYRQSPRTRPAGDEQAVP